MQTQHLSFVHSFGSVEPSKSPLQMRDESRRKHFERQTSYVYSWKRNIQQIDFFVAFSGDLGQERGSRKIVSLSRNEARGDLETMTSCFPLSYHVNIFIWIHTLDSWHSQCFIRSFSAFNITYFSVDQNIYSNLKEEWHFAFAVGKESTSIDSVILSSKSLTSPIFYDVRTV